MNFSVLKNFSSNCDLSSLLEVYNDLPLAGWSAGRQGTGYEKYLLGKCDEDLELGYYPILDEACNKSLEALSADSSVSMKSIYFWDCYFIRMVDGAYITPHTDHSNNGPHHRLDVLVTNCERGGIFTLEGTQADLQVGDALKFRPDLDRHEITMVTGDCERLMFSVGCILPGDLD